MSTGFAKAETKYCGSTRLTRAIQYIEWNQKNTYYNQMVRYVALEESLKVEKSARALAWGASLVFLLSISLLAAAITYRVLENQNLATLLGAVYFLFFSFMLMSAREAINNITVDFRDEVSTTDVRDLPQEVSGPESLHEFMTVLRREQARVPEVFTEKASYMPLEGRWWTMGWDDVSLIDFQNEAYRATIRKADISYRAISSIRKKLEEQCRASSLEI
jgi:hypothetical protein